MSLLPIYTYGASVLKKKAKPVTEVSDSVVKLIMDMFETMRNANGIGLAATQVGNLRRVIVIDVSDLEETKGFPPFAMINPEVVSEEGSWPMEEGCLSIPDIRDEVERAETIRVKFKDAQYKDVEIEAGGLLGRVILHEIDHLNGILFIDHLDAKKKKVHAVALKQIQRGEIDVSYPVVTAANVSV
jgi:peptide deformylase